MKANIIYPYTNLDFPSRKANMLQTINTCHALAENGKARVHFIIRNPKKWSVKNILDFYGLEECPELFIHSIAIPSTQAPFVGQVLNLFFRLNLYCKTLGLARKFPDSYVYARDINVLSFLIKFKSLVAMKIVYEVHSIQAWFFKNLHNWHDTARSFPHWKVKLYEYKEKGVLTKVDLIVTVIYRLKEILIEDFGVDEKKIFVIPNGAKLIPLKDFSTPQMNGRSVAGYVGQLNPARGVDMLVKAMTYLDSKFYLIIVGGSKDNKDVERLKKLAEDFDVIDRISFTGYIEPSKIVSHLLQFDAVVLPLLDHPNATDFACSLKQFEYMAVKKPIVATDILCNREFLKDRENAVLVKPNDPEALASGIRLVLEDKQLGSHIAENAYKDVCEKYSWEKRAENILSTIDGIH